MPRRFAAADIGSNTVHLLVGEITARGGIRRVVNESEWLSLGEIVSQKGEIPLVDSTRLIETLRRYKRLAEENGAEQFYVFATEAVRVARNHKELLSTIKKTLGIKVDLIPAVREAELSLLGVTLDTHVHNSLLMIEVGGGSAQVALCDGKTILDEQSLPIGTGRMIGQFGMKQPCPPEAVEAIRQHIRGFWDQCPQPQGVTTMVASGGVARGIIRALHPDGDRMIQLYELDYLVRSIMGMDIESIAKRFRVKIKRAGSLLPGAIVFQEMLYHYHQDRFLVSEYGVREGAILEIARAGVTK